MDVGVDVGADVVAMDVGGAATDEHAVVEVAEVAEVVAEGAVAEVEGDTDDMIPPRHEHVVP